VDVASQSLDIASQKYYAQINLCVDNLRKTYLRSGTYRLSKPDTKERIGFMLSELESAVQSDELLVFDEKFSLHILFTLIPVEFRNNNVYHEMGLQKNNQNMKVLIYLERKFCTLAMLGLSNANRNVFSILISHGILDFSLFSKKPNKCFLVSLVIAKITIECHHDSRLIFEFLQKNRFDIDNLMAKLIPTFIENLELACDVQIEVFEFLARQYLNCQIYLCTKDLNKSTSNCFHILHKTKFKNINSVPIYLYLKISEKNKNSVHLSNIIMLNTFKKKFCYFCEKYIRNSSFKKHKCKLLKCHACYRYKGDVRSINGVAQCNMSQMSELPENCKLCGINFTSYICESMHRLSKVNCSLNKKRHTLANNEDLQFCLRCFGQHNKATRCSLFENVDKKQNVIVYIVVYNNILNEAVLIQMSQFDTKENAFKMTLVSSNYEYTTVFENLKQCIMHLRSMSTNKIVSHSSKKMRKDTIARVLQLCKSNNLCQTVILGDGIFFDSTLEHFYDAASNLKLKAGRITNFKLFKTNIIAFDIFVDLHAGISAELSYLSNSQNVHASLLLPKINEPIMESEYEFQSEFFDVENLRFSSHACYLSVKHSISKIKSLYWDRKLKYGIILRIHTTLNCLLMHDYSVLVNSIYNKIRLKMNLTTKNCFQYTSLTQIGYDLFLKSVHNEGIPILPATGPQFIKNTSKYEYIVSSVLGEMHKNCGADALYSNFINSRELFKVNKLSADFACNKCEHYFFVQGNYKNDCDTHNKNVDIDKVMFNFLSKRENIKRSKDKINKFKNGLKSNAIIYVLNECCLKNVENYLLFIEYINKHKTLSLDEVLKVFKLKLKTYKRNHFSGICYNKTIPNALVLPVKYISTSTNANIVRFDLSSAFPTALRNCKIPVGAGTVLLEDNAEKFYNSYNRDSNILVVIKVRLECRKSLYLPYYDHASKPENAKGASLKRSGTCFKCCLSSNNHYINCRHRDRSFVTTLLDKDLEYMLSIGYTLKNVYELHYFRTKTIHTLNSLCDIYETLIQSSVSKLEKKLLKQLNLRAIGRTAMDVGKYQNETLIHSSEELFCKFSNIKHFDFLPADQICIANLLKNKNERYHQYLRFKTCPLIFAIVASTVKRLIHAHALKIYFSYNLSLVRIDTDCITVFLHNQNDIIHLNAIFYKTNTIFNYKLEHKDIQCVVSYGKQAYIFINKDLSVVYKISGALLNNRQRYTKIKNADELNLLIENCLFKLDNPKRVLPRTVGCPEKLQYTYQIQSFPFGYKFRK
jgi:hypothetical protein